MANSFIKAEKVVRQALGLLEREVVLPGMVWRDAGGNFAGAKNDTITLRVPAYTTARTRVLRAGTAIVTDDLQETSVDVRLDTDVYKAIGISDEELTLDIDDFGVQVNQPAMASVGRQVEDSVADEMTSATYEVSVDLDEDDPYLGLVDARIALNDASVPMGSRFLAVGSRIEAAILKSDRLSKFDGGGPAAVTAMQEALIGRIAGFTAVSVPGLDPDTAIAAHLTAFVLSMQAPIVPQGATWGASQSWNGLAMRALRDYDFTNTRDRFLADVYIGTATTKDRGTIGEDGKFVPSVDGEDDPILVRAVKCTLPGAGSS